MHPVCEQWCCSRLCISCMAISHCLLAAMSPKYWWNTANLYLLLVFAIRCPLLSSSPHPTLSLRLGESFLLCVSPPCGAEAGGQTDAPFFNVLLSSYYFYRWSDADASLRWFYRLRMSQQTVFSALSLFLFCSLFTSVASPALRSELWLFERTGAAPGMRGVEIWEVVPKPGFSEPRGGLHGVWGGPCKPALMHVYTRKWPKHN